MGSAVCGVAQSRTRLRRPSRSSNSRPSMGLYRVGNNWSDLEQQQQQNNWRTKTRLGRSRRGRQPNGTGACGPRGRFLVTEFQPYKNKGSPAPAHRCMSSLVKGEIQSQTVRPLFLLHGKNGNARRSPRTSTGCRNAAGETDSSMLQKVPKFHQRSQCTTLTQHICCFTRMFISALYSEQHSGPNCPSVEDWSQCLACTNTH